MMFKRILLVLLVVFSFSSIATATPSLERERETPETYEDYKAGKKAESDFYKMAIPATAAFMWYVCKGK